MNSTTFLDVVLWIMATIGAIALCLLLGQAIANRIHPPPKVEEDDFTRCSRMLMEAQDEAKRLLAGDLKKNELKIRANQCLQGILIRALDDAGLKKQKEVVHPPQENEDFSFLLKKKLRTYWKPKLNRISHRWERSDLHRYYVHGLFLLQTKMPTLFGV
jgi:hypothetical protein